MPRKTGLGPRDLENDQRSYRTRTHPSGHAHQGQQPSPPHPPQHGGNRPFKKERSDRRSPCLPEHIRQPRRTGQSMDPVHRTRSIELGRNGHRLPHRGHGRFRRGSPESQTRADPTLANHREQKSRKGNIVRCDFDRTKCQEPRPRLGSTLQTGMQGDALHPSLPHVSMQ